MSQKGILSWIRTWEMGKKVELITTHQRAQLLIC